MTNTTESETPELGTVANLSSSPTASSAGPDSDERMSMPSAGDIARGAKAMWAPAISNEQLAAMDAQEAIAKGHILPTGTQPTGSVQAAITAMDVPPDVINAVSGWLKNGPSQSEAELKVLDEQHQASTEVDLMALWGDSYDSNIAAIKAWVSRQKPEIASVILNGRLADGRAIANSPDMLVRMLSQARGPQPASGSKDVASQIREIEKFMRENRRAYNRDEPLQARYRELLSMRGH